MALRIPWRRDEHHMALFAKSGVRDATTLVVESTDVRFLVTRGGQVSRWGSAPLPDGLIEEGRVTDPAELGRHLDQLFTEFSLDRKHAITSLSGLRSIPRLLTLPKLQASLMEEAISREARKEMPISPESLYLSWQSMPADDTLQRIYVLGVPRDLVDAHIQALQAAQITPFVMDLKPLALIRAIGQPEAIIACLEQDVLDLVLVVEYIPAIMRTFALDRENLDPAGKIERLLGELAQTVRFYNDSHHDAPIRGATPVFLTGRLLGTPEAADMVRSALDRTVERPTSPLPGPEALPVSEYMTNLGLAMKKVSR